MASKKTKNASDTITILLVDDHTVVRQGTRDMLISHPQLTVVGEADSGENLEGLLKVKQPDLLLLDINLPGKNGLELLKELKPRFPDLKIILFTAHTDPQYIRRGIHLGADGYLSKAVSKEELQNAVFDCVKPAGKAVYSKDILQKINELEEDAPILNLTTRELEILTHVAQGQTNKEIANTLFLSVKTVDTHVANLMKKLGVSNRSQLTAFAYERGFL